MKFLAIRAVAYGGLLAALASGQTWALYLLIVALLATQEILIGVVFGGLLPMVTLLFERPGATTPLASSDSMPHGNPVPIIKTTLRPEGRHGTNQGQ